MPNTTNPGGGDDGSDEREGTGGRARKGDTADGDGTSRWFSRREMLALTGTSITAGLAGCPADPEQLGLETDTPAGVPTGTDAGTPTGTDAGTPTDTTTPGDTATPTATPTPEAVFEVSNLSPTDATVTRGDVVNVSVTVTNTGDGSGAQTVELRLDGSTVATESVQLDAGASASASLSADTTGLDLGTYTHGVFTDDDSATGTLTVEDTVFEVSGLSPTEATVTAGDVIDASATVTNTGNAAGTGDVEFRVGGTAVATTSVTLDAGGSTTATFDGVDTAGLDPGEYTHGAFTADDSATGTLTVVDLTAGLASHWSFEAETVESGVVADQSPNGNDGTVVGDPGVVPGAAGEGLDLDGAGDWVQVDHDSSLQVQTGDFTLAGWINTRESSGNAEALISKKTDDGAGDNQLAYQLCLNGYGAPDNSPVFVYATDSGLATSRPGTTLSAGSYYHLAVSYDHSEASVDWYVDGARVKTESMSGSPITNGQELFLGAHFDNGGNPSQAVNGVLDDVRIYGERKSEGFVRQLYEEGTGRLEVTGLSPGDTTITPGDSVDVGATVTNTGGRAESGTVEVSFDGSPLTSESVTLGSGESTTVTGGVDTSGFEAGERYTYTVRLGEEERTGSLTVIDASLAGYWSFESGTVSGGTVTDASLNDNAGTFVGDPAVVPGAVGDGLDLDGNGDWVQVDHDSSLQVQTGDFTLAGWVKPRETRATGNTRPLVSKKSDSGVADSDLAYQLSIGGYGFVSGGPSVSNAPTFVYHDGSSLQVASVDQSLSPGSYYHLAVTHGADGTVDWYIDGSHVETDSLSGSPITNGQELFLGVHFDNGGNPSFALNGILDEIRIYDERKDAAFVGKLYSHTSPRLDVTGLPSGDVSLVQGETATLSAGLANTGGIEGTGTAELRVDGELRASESVTLADGETSTVSFDVDTGSLEPDEYAYEIAFGDEALTGSLVVEDPGPVYFTVDGLTPGETTVQQGETIQVGASVTNIGSEEGTETVEVRVDGTAESQQDVTLGPDETTTVSIDLDTSTLDSGYYTYGVYSPDDEATAQLVLTDSALAAYWSFDAESITNGTVSDLSPNANAGTIQGGAGTTDGAVDEGVDLDGSDDWVQVDHDDTLAVQTGDFTLAGWIYTRRSNGNAEALFSKKTNGGAGDGQLAYQLCLNGYGAPNNGPAFVYSNGSGPVSSTLDQYLAPESHYHVAISYDHSEGTVDWYLDGVKVETESMPGSPITNGQELFLGAHFDAAGSPSQAVNGILDELRIYNEQKGESFVRGLVEPGLPETTYRPQFRELLNDQFTGGGFTDPLPVYDPTRDPPYLLSVNDNSNNTTDLYESSDLSTWSLVANDITPDLTDDGGTNLQDYAKVDGTYHVYASLNDNKTIRFSGPDFQSLTNEGVVIEDRSDCGVWYDGSTYYLYTEGEPYQGQPTSNELLVHTSGNPGGPFELQGVAVDVSDRVWHTGDPCIIDAGDHYDMFMDRSINHATYTIALARSTDLLNWEVVDDGITHYTGGDMQVLDIGDRLVSFTEFTGINRGQNGVGRWDVVEL